MADTHDLKFVWPQGPRDVIVTGTFDNWSCSTHMIPSPSGGLEAIIPVPWDTKVSFKFVVDGNWMHNPDLPSEYDSNGNINNVVFTPRKPVPKPGEPTFEIVEDVAPSTSSEEETTTPVPVVEEAKPETPEKAPEIASRVALAIQPVLDSAHDSTPKEAVNSEASTHSPLPLITADTTNKLTEDPVPETGSDKFLEAVLAPSNHPASAAEAETPARPSTPPPKKAEEVPVTPIKVNSEHTRSSTLTTSGLSTPPSSSAPSTPKTQSAFTVDEGNSPGKTSVKIKKRQSILGKLKKVFRSPEKDKNKKRFGSESPTRGEKVKA